MIDCPSQHVNPNNWKELGTGLCINGTQKHVSKYTKSCSVNESPISDFNINEITFLDYKLSKILPDEDLLILEQYLLSNTQHKTLHIVNEEMRRRPLLFHPLWEQLLQFLNKAEKRFKPTLEILNLDYDRLFSEGLPSEKLPDINSEWWQIDYHHVLSDSEAYHYPIYLNPEAEEADCEGCKQNHIGAYNSQQIKYNPKANRERKIT